MGLLDTDAKILGRSITSWVMRRIPIYTCCCKCVRLGYVCMQKMNDIQLGNRTANTSNQFNMYDQRMPGMRGIVLDFGYKVPENLSRYIRPDWHQNGYMVACGSQTESKVHFWYVFYDRSFYIAFSLTHFSQGYSL